MRKMGVVRWRQGSYLKRVIAGEGFGVEFHPRYVGKLLKKLGFSHISTGRAIRLRTSGSSRRLKKLPARAESSSRGNLRAAPVWKSGFEMKAEISEKNGLVRQWARRGTRPIQPADQRYDNAYLFGADLTARGVEAALALP